MSEALDRLGRIEADLAAIKDLLQRIHGTQPATAGGVTRHPDGPIFAPGTGTIGATNPHHTCPPPCDGHGFIHLDTGGVTFCPRVDP